MRRRDMLGRSFAAGIFATAFAASAAQAALPTGGMLLQRPRGPARADMPCSTSISATRVPSAAGYGLVGGPAKAESNAELAGRKPAAGTPAAAKPGAMSEPGTTPRTAAFDAADPFAPPEPAKADAVAVAEDPTPPRELIDQHDPFAEEISLEPAPTELVAAEGPVAEFAGLKGICPVTLREERKNVAPRPEIFSEHAGRRYEFATPEAKAAFDADPERYAPVLGGRDVVLTAGGAAEAVGTLQHAGFYRERLYLFQTEESCKEFYEDPQRFLVGE